VKLNCVVLADPSNAMKVRRDLREMCDNLGFDLKGEG
jgi:hypothetical protein